MKTNSIKTEKMTNTALQKGYTAINGINMYYEIHGDGEPLVLIHGGGSTIYTSFGKVLPLLASKYQVIGVELQAHGHTSDRDAPESFEQDADDVAALLKKLNITRANIFGFSNGGNTAIQIAVRHPEVVNRLILASTFYKREGLLPGLFEGMKTATIDVMPEALKNAFMEITHDSNKLMTMFNKDRERMLNFKDWPDSMLASVTAPTLLISGDKDVILPEHVIAMSKLIPNNRVIILPSMHGSYIGVAESPAAADGVLEMTVHTIKNFLDEQLPD